jgi:hypothetical protein
MLLSSSWFDRRALVLTAATALATSSGCVDVSTSQVVPKSGPGLIAEGTLLTIAYDQGNGKVGGLTRLGQAEAVPGGHGSWNVDAKVKVTEAAAVITFQGATDPSPLVIPLSRVISVQLGDAGIKTVPGGSSSQASTR